MKAIWRSGIARKQCNRNSKAYTKYIILLEEFRRYVGDCVSSKFLILPYFAIYKQMQHVKYSRILFNAIYL